MSTLYELVDRLARAQLTLAALAICAILVAISLDVTLRTIFRAPLTGTMEVVSFYCMIPVVFLPIMMLELRGQHIDTDLFYNLFPVSLKRLSIVISGMLSIGIYGMLTYFTFEQALSSTLRREVSMGVNLMPIWPVRWVLPFAFATSALGALLLCFRALKQRANDV